MAFGRFVLCLGIILCVGKTAALTNQALYDILQPYITGGVCPPLPPGTVGPCVVLCNNCEARGMMCCSNGCGYVCKRPVKFPDVEIIDSHDEAETQPPVIDDVIKLPGRAHDPVNFQFILERIGLGYLGHADAPYEKKNYDDNTVRDFRTDTTTDGDFYFADGESAESQFSTETDSAENNADFGDRSHANDRYDFSDIEHDAEWIVTGRTSADEKTGDDTTTEDEDLDFNEERIDYLALEALAEQQLEETIESQEQQAEETIESQEQTAEETIESQEQTAEETIESQEQTAEETIESQEQNAEEMIESEEIPEDDSIDDKDNDNSDSNKWDDYSDLETQAAATAEKVMPYTTFSDSNDAGETVDDKDEDNESSENNIDYQALEAEAEDIITKWYDTNEGHDVDDIDDTDDTDGYDHTYKIDYAKLEAEAESTVEKPTEDGNEDDDLKRWHHHSHHRHYHHRHHRRHHYHRHHYHHRRHYHHHHYHHHHHRHHHHIHHHHKHHHHTHHHHIHHHHHHIHHHHIHHHHIHHHHIHHHHKHHHHHHIHHHHHHIHHHHIHHHHTHHHHIHHHHKHQHHHHIHHHHTHHHHHIHHHHIHHHHHHHHHIHHHHIHHHHIHHHHKHHHHTHHHHIHHHHIHHHHIHHHHIHHHHHYHHHHDHDIRYCKCNAGVCECCLQHTFEIHALTHIVRFRLDGCVILEYLSHKRIFELTFTVNGATIFHHVIHLDHTPRICYKPPVVGRFAKVCLQLYDIYIPREHACARLELVVFGKSLLHIKIGCMTLRPPAVPMMSTSPLFKNDQSLTVIENEEWQTQFDDGVQDGDSLVNETDAGNTKITPLETVSESSLHIIGLDDTDAPLHEVETQSPLHDVGPENTYSYLHIIGIDDGVASLHDDERQLPLYVGTVAGQDNPDAVHEDERQSQLHDIGPEHTDSSMHDDEPQSVPHSSLHFVGLEYTDSFQPAAEARLRMSDDSLIKKILTLSKTTTTTQFIDIFQRLQKQSSSKL